MRCNSSCPNLRHCACEGLAGYNTHFMLPRVANCTWFLLTQKRFVPAADHRGLDVINTSRNIGVQVRVSDLGRPPVSILTDWHVLLTGSLSTAAHCHGPAIALATSPSRQPAGCVLPVYQKQPQN